ncbi:ras-related protein Rab-30-like [Dendronephthya gigantea]|uniref:ras-related protein Rab-30-like n=1 Tax=Dendronephthya gigantea TaxID=151771 RepID=UPI001069554A|nr:ras-related protein Rab-30-like [Dendronephthya gigantea]
MDDDSKYKYLFKVVLIGDASVGKTCLLRRYAKGLFIGNPGATIGVDFMMKNVDINDEVIKLQLWDTAGQERFRSLTHSYYNNAHAVVIVYDITNKRSFENLPSWLDDVHRYCKKDAIKLLVGNKKDLNDKREVDCNMAKEIGSACDIVTMETSAKDDENVDILFDSIAMELSQRLKNTDDEERPVALSKDVQTITIKTNTNNCINNNSEKLAYPTSCCKM